MFAEGVRKTWNGPVECSQGRFPWAFVVRPDVYQIASVSTVSRGLEVMRRDEAL